MGYGWLGLSWCCSPESGEPNEWSFYFVMLVVPILKFRSYEPCMQSYRRRAVRTYANLSPQFHREWDRELLKGSRDNSGIILILENVFLKFKIDTATFLRHVFEFTVYFIIDAWHTFFLFYFTVLFAFFKRSCADWFCWYKQRASELPFE